MINNEIDSLISSAMKEHDEKKKLVYRAIKDALLKWKTAKENIGKELTEAEEVSIIKKMIKQREDTISMCSSRTDIVESEQAEINLLKPFLPAEITKEQIENEVSKLFENGIEPIKKNMGLIIKTVKFTYPTVDGKLLSQIVGSKLS